MQPDHHEMLYGKLAEIMERANLALKEMDPEILLLLAQEQNAVIKDLQKAGVGADRRHLGRVLSLNMQVSDMIAKILRCRQEISARIKQIADGKKMVRAYVT